MKHKIGDYVVHQNPWNDRVFKIIKVRNDYECKVQDTMYKSSISWWRLSDFKPITKETHPEYYL